MRGGSEASARRRRLGWSQRQIELQKPSPRVRLLLPPFGTGPAHRDGDAFLLRAGRKDLLSNLDELDGMFQHDPAASAAGCRWICRSVLLKNGDPASADFFTAISGHRTGAEQQRSAGGRDPRGGLTAWCASARSRLGADCPPAGQADTVNCASGLSGAFWLSCNPRRIWRIIA